MSTTTTAKPRQKKPAPLATPGYIYILASSNGEWFKIGKATIWAVRVVKQLKVQLPFPVVVRYAFKSEDCTRDETALHRRFKSKRLNGEWFSLDEGDLEHIRQFCNYKGFSVDEAGVYHPDPLAGAEEEAAIPSETEAEE